ncbi:hypothetical protein [Streptomyces sp. NPDC091278]|uniref:hypothetical protein n=1 Tax=Streptomyces sp. NPDC091278 TaxID=3155301 RepID=UPI00344B63A6
MAIDPTRVRRLAREADEVGRRVLDSESVTQMLAALTIVDTERVVSGASNLHPEEPISPPQT